MLRLQYCFCTLFLLYVLCAKGQNKPYTVPDSLKSKSYNELIDLVNNPASDSVKKMVYVNTYIAKAKNEKNKNEIIYGYRKKLDFFPLKVQELYTDTIMHIAQQAKNPELIGNAYIFKATIKYSEKEYQNSLNDYIEADKYIPESNGYLKYKIKYGIANMQYYMGHYIHSLELFRSCRDYYKDKKGVRNVQGYLYSLRMMGRCYFELGKYNETTAINVSGLKKSKAAGRYLVNAYFRQSEGMNQYMLHNYGACIEYINTSMPQIKRNRDFANETLNDLYLGKSYIALNNYDSALPYLTKVDSLFRQKHYTNPELREAYEILIEYYREQSDPAKQLEYTNQLLAVDKVLKENSDYMSDKIYTDYDTRRLKNEKLRLQSELEENKRIDSMLFLLVSLLVITICGFAYFSYKRQLRYRRKYEKLISAPKEKAYVEEPVAENKITTPDINSAIVNEILTKLEKFEEEKGFLNKHITQSVLAEMFATNTSYLSKIINHYKGKNFNAYINELRINYGIYMLKTHKKYRKYSIKALSEELGFSNPRSFSDTFFAHTGLKPSYFISKLLKETPDD